MFFVAKENLVVLSLESLTICNCSLVFVFYGVNSFEEYSPGSCLFLLECPSVLVGLLIPHDWIQAMSG